jgi:hypothetical protein
MLLVFMLCLSTAMTGCRRGGKVKRDPVIVKDEKDLLLPVNESERLFKMLPTDRKYSLWIETITEVEQRVPEGQRKQEFRKLADQQDDLEKDKEQEAKVSTGKAAAAVKESKYEFEYFVPWVFKFIKAKKDTPKAFNKEDFYTYVRREDAVYIRKWLDKTNMEVTKQEVRLIKLIDPPTLHFVPDIDPNEEDYIIAYRDASGGGGMMGGGPPMGPPMGGGGGAAGPSKYIWFNKENGFDDTFDPERLTTTLKHQDLRLLRKNFIAFSRGNYLRPPADAEENKLWKENNIVFRDFDAALHAVVYQKPQPPNDGGAPSVLKHFEERMPRLLKTPPDPFDTGKFKKYLEENAPPSVSSKLKNAETAINAGANLRNPADIVACRTEMEWSRLANKQELVALGHWVILTTGEIRLASTQELRRFTVVPEPKKQGGGFGPIQP